MRGYETARQIIAKHRDAVRAHGRGAAGVESLDADGIRALVVGGPVTQVAAMQAK